MRFAGYLYRHDELTSNLRVLRELDPSVRVRASDWDKLFQRGCETYGRYAASKFEHGASKLRHWNDEKASESVSSQDTTQYSITHY